MSDRNRIFGWDLPPGVRESDIPGNRPEDVQLEQEIESFEKDLGELIDTHLRHAEQMEPMHVNESLVSIANSNKEYDKEKADEARQNFTSGLLAVLERAKLHGVSGRRCGPNEIEVTLHEVRDVDNFVTQPKQTYIIHVLPGA